LITCLILAMSCAFLSLPVIAASDFGNVATIIPQFHRTAQSRCHPSAPVRCRGRSWCQALISSYAFHSLSVYILDEILIPTNYTTDTTERKWEIPRLHYCFKFVLSRFQQSLPPDCLTIAEGKVSGIFGGCSALKRSGALPQKD